MTAEVVQLRPTWNPVCVEITSPGTVADGRRIYFVDIVEKDGSRACMWSGFDHKEAKVAAVECAEDGFNGLPVVDLAGKSSA